MARPPIPKPIAAVVWSRAQGHCERCKGRVMAGHGEINHIPALAMRERVPGLADTDPAAYVPHANDINYMQLLHGEKSGLGCHKLRTFGDGLYRGDVTENARSREITAKETEHHEAMRRKLLAPNEPETEEPKSKWSTGRKLQGRPFAKVKRPMRGS